MPKHGCEERHQTIALPSQELPVAQVRADDESGAAVQRDREYHPDVRHLRAEAQRVLDVLDGREASAGRETVHGDAATIHDAILEENSPHGDILQQLFQETSSEKRGDEDMQDRRRPGPKSDLNISRHEEGGDGAEDSLVRLRQVCPVRDRDILAIPRGGGDADVASNIQHQLFEGRALQGVCGVKGRIPNPLQHCSGEPSLLRHHLLRRGPGVRAQLAEPAREVSAMLA
mmetsp:Transcript_58403/g.190495  ORF Transcript_58403/g.190495 Transcript_58403/m.190495 type:complete len:230 (-) Transcript_58403:687-1376(-)